MTNFKYSLYFSSSLFLSTAYADISSNKTEKDAKVIDSVVIAENTRVWPLYAERWELTRTGETVLSLPALKKVTNAWLQDRTKLIQVQYPGGEEGELWVQELMDWLVSLGIPSENMLAVPGSGADDVIKLSLVK